jgi:hypothetical protein
VPLTFLAARDADVIRLRLSIQTERRWSKLRERLA